MPARSKAARKTTVKTTENPIEAPKSLGIKRACPKCSAKVYDFCRAEIECPKCHTKFAAASGQAQVASFAELKRSTRPAKPKPSEELVKGEEAGSEEVVESVEDLQSDDDEIVDDLLDDDDKADN